MSGGSYNYLCHVDVSELMNRTGDLEAMTKRLMELGHKDFARMNERLLLEIEWFRLHLEEQKAFLEPAWHAIEWRDSGDYSDETVAKVLQGVREKILKGKAAK